MLHPGVYASGLTQAEVITRQHCARVLRIARAGARSPGAVSLRSVEPTHQIASRSANCAGPRERIGRRQVEPSSRNSSGIGLGPYLDQLVLTRQGPGSSGYRVLCLWRHLGTTSLGCRRRRARTRPTGQKARTHEGAEESSVSNSLKKHSAVVLESTGAPPRPERNRIERMLIVEDGEGGNSPDGQTVVALC